MSKPTRIFNPSVTSCPCFDFTPDGVQREKRTVIIAPIIIDEIKPGVLQIGWTCSRGHFCQDKECFYSQGSRHKNESKKVADPSFSYCDR